MLPISFGNIAGLLWLCKILRICLCCPVKYLVSGDWLSEADWSRRWEEVAYVLWEANFARSERWMPGRWVEGML